MKNCFRMAVNKIVLPLLTVLILFNHTQANAFESRANFGAGLGIPYGVFGVNFELELNVADSFAISPSVGVGTTILAGGATSLGVRLHFGDKDGLFRFGLSYWTGTNTVVETRTGFSLASDYESEDGNTAGINLRFQFGRSRNHGVDVGILKILTPTEDELNQKYGGTQGQSQGGDIRIAVGYVRRF